MNTPYVARDPGPNPNISSQPPLRLFAILVAAALAVAFLAWLILGSLVSVAARQMPDEVEARIGALMPLDALQDEDWIPAQLELQAMVEDLAGPLPQRSFAYRVVIVEESTPNAFAIPGGGIVVHSGLLREAGSENEVAMVLAHELAHHAHRDHLEGMGRGLVLGLIMNTIFGGDFGLDQLTGAGARGLALKMSRDDERDADRLALLLLDGRYGHVGGATDFFVRMGDQPGGRAASWLTTHPLSSDRVRRVHEEIDGHGYAVAPLSPLRLTMP